MVWYNRKSVFRISQKLTKETKWRREGEIWRTFEFPKCSWINSKQRVFVPFVSFCDTNILLAKAHPALKFSGAWNRN